MSRYGCVCVIVVWTPERGGKFAWYFDRWTTQTEKRTERHTTQTDTPTDRTDRRQKQLTERQTEQTDDRHN